MSRTPARLGLNHSAHAIGFQVSAATLGGAAVPGLASLLAQRWGLETIAQLSVLLAICIWLLHELLLKLTPLGGRLPAALAPAESSSSGDR